MNVVKNRAPAPIQISAEQIVREAADRQIDAAQFVEPIVKIHDAEEYQQHLADRRTLFEKNIRYRREHIGNWIKYAKFEEENKEYERARSVYERALEVEFRNATLWLRYVEFELRVENINHARNVLDRAIQILPRVDFLWYKYVWMEELCQDYAKCRTVFERWVQWLPDDNVWIAYARFEVRQNNNDSAQNILQRYCQAYPTCNAYVKYAKFVEYEMNNIPLARSIYETALTTLELEEIQSNARFFIQFTNMEERQNEYDRARVIYQYAIQLLQLNDDDDDNMNSMDTTTTKDDEISKDEKSKRQQLYQQYLTFEKKHGTKNQIEFVVVQQHQKDYEAKIVQNPYDYDLYIEYTTMLQDYQQQQQHQQQPSSLSSSDAAALTTTQNQIRDIYERGMGQVPPDPNHKDSWRRYIYIVIYYAIYEELMNRNRSRAIQIYTTCLNKIIPHSKFTFLKIWILLGQLYIRDHNIVATRKLFGRALGTILQHAKKANSPNAPMKKLEKMYDTYIQIELALGEIDRCRKLYNQMVQQISTRSTVWIQYANFEATVGESDRCRAIYELALSMQDKLDSPEMVWKSYIDYEMEEGDSDKVRILYDKLLQLTQHIKVYISYGQFECTSIGSGIAKAREIFQQAYQYFKSLNNNDHMNHSNNGKEERVLLLDAWRALEKVHGTMDDVAVVERKMPRRIKRKRMRYDDSPNDGHRTELGYEEYFDYQFPDDDQDATATGETVAAAARFKMLEMAAKWKEEQKKKRLLENDSDDDDDDSDDEW